MGGGGIVAIVMVTNTATCWMRIQGTIIICCTDYYLLNIFPFGYGYTAILHNPFGKICLFRLFHGVLCLLGVLSRGVCYIIL